ncbi:MAG: DUF3300 domain-containing protein, partial [Proteobacteria bacterium]|nr:DUF3300 domain-containing protein [Pseudomonadota bacterium]
NNMPLHQPAKGGLPPMGVGTVDWFGTGAAGRGIATGGTGGSGGVNGPGGAGAPGAVILEW